MRQPLRPIESSAGGTLATLRALIPQSSLQYQDALLTAERLATRLLGLYGVTTAPVPTRLVSGLPKIAVVVHPDMPELTSGSSLWDSTRGRWVIAVNGREPDTRQRFTVMHEFFHVLVHRHVDRGLFTPLRPEQIEYVADYFAGCALVPKRLLNGAWASGIQTIGALGEVFDVSPRAIEVRLSQIRLIGTGSEYKVLVSASAEGTQ